MRSAWSTAVVLVGLLAAPTLSSCSFGDVGSIAAAEQSATTATSTPALTPILTGTLDSTTSPTPPPTTTVPTTNPSSTATTDSTTDATTTMPAAPPTTAAPPPTTAPVAPLAPVEHQLVATIIGDSYSTGALTDSGGSANWPEFVEQGLRDNGITTTFTLAALGATGYIAGRETAESFPDRVAGAVTPATELVIVFGSRNDGPVLLVDGGADELRTAATDTYSAIRAIAPGATLVVIGAPWVNENVPDAIAGVEGVLLDVADDFGAVFVDPVAEGWFFGDDQRFIGPDGVHPNAEGQAYIAARILPVVLDAANATRLCGNDGRVRPRPCGPRSTLG